VPCKRCSALIVWSRTNSGKSMPLDAVPNSDGNVAAHRDHLGVLRAEVLPKGQEPLRFMRRYMPHFATCAPTVAHRQGVRDGSVVELGRARRRKGRAR
jgi:hypothetical protein